MEKSHIFGEFLVKNKVIELHQLHRALEEQRRVAHEVGLLSRWEEFMRRDDLERVMIRMYEKSETEEQAILSLGILTREELNELIIDERPFRQPIGRILVQQEAFTPLEMRTWLKRFKQQKFDDKNTFYEILNNIPLFSDLSEEQLEELHARADYDMYAAEEVIYREGFESQHLYLIETGLVRLSVNSGLGKLEHCLQAREFFGFQGVLSEQPRLENAVAVINTRVWKLTKETLRRTLQNNPAGAFALAEHMSDEIDKTLQAGRSKAAYPYPGTGKLRLVILERGEFTGGNFVALLARELLRESEGDVFFLHSMEVPGWDDCPAATTDEIQALESSAVLECGKKRMFALQAPRLESRGVSDLEKLFARLQDVERKYKSIFIVVNHVENDYTQFRKYVMASCRRSVTVLDKQAPPFIGYFRPGRDRIYLVHQGTLDATLIRYRRALALLERNSAAAAPHAPRMEDRENFAGHLARWLSCKAIGIAFSGGGARGLAHVGALQALQPLQKEGLYFDSVSGSSAGCIIAAFAAQARDAHDMEQSLIKNLARARKSPFGDYRLLFFLKSLLKGRRAKRLLRKAFGDAHCLETKISFFPVATDVLRVQEAVVRDAPIWKAVLASGAAPGFFPLVRLDDALLGDGGLINNIPASTLKEHGCDFVLALDACVDPSKCRPNVNSSVSMILHDIDILMRQAQKDPLRHADMVIEPPVDHFGVREFHQSRTIINLGRHAMELRLDELKRRLAKIGIIGSAGNGASNV